MVDTCTRAPLTKAPPPLAAQPSNPWRGQCAAPATTSPSCSKPISTAHNGIPRTKSRVPSIGSMIHLRPLRLSPVGAFFAEYAIFRKLASEPFHNQLFASPIGGGDGRLIRFRLRRHAASLIIERERTGLLRQFLRDFYFVFKGHASLIMA